MAAEKKDQSGSVWYKIFNGSWLKRANEQNFDVKIADSSGKDTFWESFESISGILTDISFRASSDPKKYGEELIVTLKDGEEIAKFSTPVSSRIGKGILQRLPNIHAGYYLKLRVFLGEKKDATSKAPNCVSIFLGDQFGHNYEKVEAYYTPQDPKGMPLIREIQAGAKTVWDDSDQIAFFKNLFFNWYLPEVLVKSGYGTDSKELPPLQQAAPAPQAQPYSRPVAAAPQQYAPQVQQGQQQYAPPAPQQYAPPVAPAPQQYAPPAPQQYAPPAPVHVAPPVVAAQRPPVPSAPPVSPTIPVQPMPQGFSNNAPDDLPF